MADTTLYPKWEGGDALASRSNVGYPMTRSAYSRQLRIENRHWRWNWGTPIRPHPLRWDAKMSACRKEGGGGVVAQRRAVMARTW